MDKYELFVKKHHGTRSQQIRALELLIPQSPMYDLLEGRIPHPSHTYSRIVEAMEAEEKAWINQEIGERRTRLGSRSDQVKLSVSREAFSKFPLESLYQQIIDWTNDDELRRKNEEKLFQRAYDTLIAFPEKDKPSKRDQVLEIANGMVIIKHPFELAWSVALEWVNSSSLEKWDHGVFRDYIELFPESGLCKVLRGYLESDISAAPPTVTLPETALEDGNIEKRLGQADRLMLLIEGFEECPNSLVAHRIMAEVYLSLEEFGNAIDIGHRAHSLCEKMSHEFRLDLQETMDSVNTNLATAMISYQSPRYHPQAKDLFYQILNRKPNDIPSLIGIGLILEEDEDYNESVAFFEKASQREPNNLRIKSELAWCRTMMQDFPKGLEELRSTLTDILATKPVDLKMKAEVLYRIGFCMWNIDQGNSARKNKEGPYRFFIESLQANPNYAPAYTMLGNYFADYGKSKKRARTAFQKAFELSASEIEAAERLARSYADSGEWDLVELVAHRVVDSGKARPAPGSKKQAYSWPFAALGVSEINKQQYSKSIVSFQSALRITPNDYNAWVGLGESYHRAGRHIAAARAFSKAESLENKPSEEQTWLARYMLANVSRDIGAFEDAINGYEMVLGMKPNEFGVSVALLQTLAETAWSYLERGVFGQAAETARKAIHLAERIAVNRSEVFNLWKSVGDACSVFGILQAEASSVDFEALDQLLNININGEQFKSLVDVDDLAGKLSPLSSDSKQISASERCLYGAVLSQRRAILAASKDVHAQAVSWYNLGWAEYRAFAFSTLKKRPQPLLKAAVRCFKRAIELEAGNTDYWNALGVATTTLNPKIAQHSFIRSLHLDDQSARAWTNLGALYLLNEDYEMANQAFTKAQSSDPDFAHAWLGQGLIALLYSCDVDEARGLFVHAFDTATSLSITAKQWYCLALFDQIHARESTLSNSPASLIQPLFALFQLRSQSPSSMHFDHLTALFAECAMDYDEAIDRLQKTCEIAEQEYEATESADYLFKFAQSKADLARALLAKREYKSAVEAAETSLDLSTEEDSESVDEPNRKRCRLSAHLTAGIAQYYLHAIEKAIPMFQSALQEAHGNPDVVCLLAQVLWAQGNEEQMSLARDQLYSCVEDYPHHVGAATLLGVIALLDEDEESIDAVRGDLEVLRLGDRLSGRDRAKVDKVLSEISTLSAGGESHLPDEIRRLQEASKSVMLSPSQSQGWTELAAAASELSRCEDETNHAAEMALKTALRMVPPRGDLDAKGLCEAYAGTCRPGDSLVGIMVAPWHMDGWNALSDMVRK